jgi:hypothetical protein
MSPGYECKVEFHQNTLVSGQADISLRPGALADRGATLANVLRVPPGAYGLAYQPRWAGRLRYFGVLFQSGAQALQSLVRRMRVDVDDSVYKFTAPVLQ